MFSPLKDNYSLLGSTCPSSDGDEDEPDRTGESPDGTKSELKVKDEQEDSGLSSQVEDSSSRDVTPPPIDEDLIEVHDDDDHTHDQLLYSRVAATSTPKEKERRVSHECR